MRRLLRLVSLLLLIALAACARIPVPPMPWDSPAASPLEADCRALFHDLDEAALPVLDSQAARIDGFPYLRVDRFLASFRNLSLDPPAFRQWIDRMQALDQAGRRVELVNQGWGDRLSDRLEEVRKCGDLLRRADMRSPKRTALLRERATVPDEYETWQRTLGLYPLTAWGVKMGSANLQEEFAAAHAIPPESRAPRGALVRYVPPETPPVDAEEVQRILRASADNPLGLPLPGPVDAERLFAAFAPVFQVDALTRNDRIGTPVWRRGAPFPEVDTERPVVYRKLSHTRAGGEILLQLNYIIWFPARPAQGAWDILSGRLDGVTWRVTLSPAGKPLLFDTMHNCGCYHLAYTTVRTRRRLSDDLLQEPIFAAHQAPEGRLALHLAAVSHLAEGISRDRPAPMDALTYRFEDYDALRTLPAPGGTKSLFRPDGVVPGTERGERFILWPMGIPHPGEMRQWGHHATAFFGRRHFDDPDLVEKNFTILPDP